MTAIRHKHPNHYKLHFFTFMISFRVLPFSPHYALSFNVFHFSLHWANIYFFINQIGIITILTISYSKDIHQGIPFQIMRLTVSQCTGQYHLLLPHFGLYYCLNHENLLCHFYIDMPLTDTSKDIVFSITR